MSRRRPCGIRRLSGKDKGPLRHLCRKGPPGSNPGEITAGSPALFPEAVTRIPCREDRTAGPRPRQGTCAAEGAAESEIKKGHADHAWPVVSSWLRGMDLNQTSVPCGCEALRPTLCVTR